MNDSKTYEPQKIMPQNPHLHPAEISPAPQVSPPSVQLQDTLFAELEVAARSGTSPPPQPIAPQTKDPIRALFFEMRNIARQYPPQFGRPTNTFSEQTRRENARIFRKQALFMQDFEDAYEEAVPLSAYFPNYQMMGYEQLRTYFTWRTRLRSGNIGKSSLSYVFLYLYELLNNIGVRGPQEGLEQLYAFWQSYREIDNTIDKYVLRWLKEYHIYYPLAQSFRDFAAAHSLTAHYPELAENDPFALYRSVSRYDLTKSAFYNTDNRLLCDDCFDFVIEKLQAVFQAAGLCFDDAVFQQTKGLSPWMPFRDALFDPWLRQPDRRVVYSDKEIYICIQDKWSFSKSIAMTSGRQLVGYVAREMESTLRGVMKYKHKLSADSGVVRSEILDKLAAAGTPLQQAVREATLEYYREATKTVVRVDEKALRKIRQEALETQEKLVIPEETALPLASGTLPFGAESPQEKPIKPPAPMPEQPPDSWAVLRAALSETELQALTAILAGQNLKMFADAHGIMAEVLADGINEKAADHMGDSILDDDFTLYDDYRENVKGMVES